MGKTLARCACGALFALAMLATACSRAPRPADIADQALLAIAADNQAVTATYFDNAARATMTASSVHRLSQIMHLFGEYQDIQEIAALDGRRYDLEAGFDHGSMLVQMRLDPDNKIAALHVIPNINAPRRVYPIQPRSLHPNRNA